MIISNIANKYLKLTSDSITAFLADISLYTQVKMNGTYNCLANNEDVQTIDTFENNSWKFDLADAVSGGEVINKLIIVNNTTGKEINAITSNIDLGYVNTNCTVTPCLMANYAGHFEPLFSTPLATLFPSPAVIVVTFSGNNVYIDGIPDGFSLKEVSFVSSAPIAPALYSNVDTETADFFIGNDAIYVKPSLFSKTEFTDGIYNVTLKLQKETGYVIENNCFFVDILTKCRVAAYLVSLIAESKSKNEQTSTIVHMLHYGLTNGSNCGCNCEEMCLIYFYLDKTLTAFKLTIDTDCEC